jgi:Fe-S cluster assembly protein SufB
MSTQEIFGPAEPTYTAGFHVPENYAFKSKKGLSREVVEQISEMKGEPEWMRKFRLKSLDLFLKRPLPTWGADLSGINFDDIYYYIKPVQAQGRSWDEVPPEIKETFDRLGIPEAERKFLAGVTAQYESEAVYHKVREDLEKLGVIFMDMDSALRLYPDLVKEYFGTIVPPSDNKFASLNSAVWSGGSFVYVPENVRVEIPLQAYFRINAQNMGQFERTLIIAEPGSYVHYVEGCFLAGARVRTREGEKLIEEVQEGDEVLTHRGRYRRVYRTMQRPYRGTIYHVRFYGDSWRTLHITEEHPLLAVRRKKAEYRNESYRPEWLPVSELKPGDYLLIPVPQVEKPVEDDLTVPAALGRGRHQPVESTVTFPLDPDFFRLVGYYHAEGHVDNEHYLTFSFHSEEKVFLEDVQELLERFFGKKAIENKPRLNGQTLVFSSTAVARAFATTFGATVFDKRVPDFISHAPKEHLAQWVRGIWCGDGSYDTRKNMFRFNSVSPELAYAFRDALLRLGIAASINLQEREEPRRPMYTVVISSPWNERFGEIVGYPAPAGKREGSPFFLDEQYLYVPIRSIEIEEMETTVYNFSVEEDESYVAEGVISHNCTAPVYSTDSLHSAVVEIIVKRGARVRYTTIQNWSKNVYNLVTKRAAAYADATMEWVDGNLGCLAQGSTVITPEGVKTIESLQVGDQVLSYDEQTGNLVFRAVKGKRFSGMQPVLTVSVGERKLRVTANHPFFSYVYQPEVARKRGRYRLGYVRADHLRQAIIPRTSLDYGRPYQLRLPASVTQSASSNQYAPSLTMSRARRARMSQLLETDERLMWLFGYWVGDGNIEVKSAQTAGVLRYAKVGFSTPPADRARPRLVETMTALLNAPAVERADGNHLYWSSTELAEFFHLNGFQGNAVSKRVPAWVWSLPASQRLAFIAGYLDADGCVVNGRFCLKSANRGLLEDVASLLTTLGITSHLYTEFAEPRQIEIMGQPCIAHGSYRLVFTADPRLCEHVSAPLRLQAQQQASKLQRNRRIGRSSLRLPESVEVVDVDVSQPSAVLVPTWDIEVEGTGNFVSQGFIVHNSKVTMKYPAVLLMEPGARGDILSVAFASDGQHQDAGAKVTHLAPYTTSQILSKSVSKGTGRASYRGLVRVNPEAHHTKCNVRCDALLLDERARTDTYPTMRIENNETEIGHEATVSKVGEDQLFYLMSRGLDESEAYSLIVNGFIEPITKELPMEYAVELNRLIQLEMSGSVG